GRAGTCRRCGIVPDAVNPLRPAGHCLWCEQELTLAVPDLVALRARGPLDPVFLAVLDGKLVPVCLEECTHMTQMRIPPDKIDANPWQTRVTEGPAYSASLAASLGEHGLLQVPAARPHPTEAGRYQLAFGHSRFTAW